MCWRIQDIAKLFASLKKHRVKITLYTIVFSLLNNHIIQRSIFFNYIAYRIVSLLQIHTDGVFSLPHGLVHEELCLLGDVQSCVLGWGRTPRQILLLKCGVPLQNLYDQSSPCHTKTGYVQCHYKKIHWVICSTL